MICIYLALILSALKAESAWDRVSPLAKLSQSELIAQIPDRFPEAKLLIVRPPQRESQPDDQSLYDAYWLTQRFKPYPGIFISAGKKLPGQFEERAWKDKHILLIESTTPRDVVFHLLLHFLLPAFSERQRWADELIELQKDSKAHASKIAEIKLRMFSLDIEVLTDQFLIEKRESFQWRSAELKSILERLSRQLSRMERELKSLEADAQTHQLKAESASEFVKGIKELLASLEKDLKESKEEKP